MAQVVLDSLDLAALLCSRVCHDVISPVGAIVNGLEVLDEEKDPDTRTFAMDLVKKSALMASAKLQFCRLAFGAAGSAGASIDTGDAESVTRGLFGDDKLKLVWTIPRVLMAKNRVKLMLNLCLIAATAVPRGGTITVGTEGADEQQILRLEAKGQYARVAPGLAGLLAGEPEGGSVEAHSIQPFFTGLVARSVDMAVTITVEGDTVVIEARPASADAQIPSGGAARDQGDAPHAGRDDAAGFNAP